MDWYTGYKLVRDGDDYTLIINLNSNSEEFSTELGTKFKENLLELDDQIKKFVKEKFPNVKVNAVKLMVGSLIVASIPFAHPIEAKAADITPASTQVATTNTLNTTGTVTASKLNVRSGPSSSYSIIHVLWKGNRVKVIGQSSGWYKIQLSNGRVGWVSSAYLNLTSNSSYNVTSLSSIGIVMAAKLNMRSGPSTSNSVIHVLWQGNRVNVTGKSGSWYQIKLSNGKIGWVSSSYLKLNNVQEKINTVISNSKSLLGTPYVWGGESPREGGFDCSGFTQYIFKQSGYTLNRISSAQATQGISVSRQNLKPGDLIFYSFEATDNINHVGIYIGNNQMIHSPKAGDVVKTTDISTSYWESRFVTARRIIY